MLSVTDDRPAPLLRPAPVRRRRARLGVARMLVTAALKALALVGVPLGLATWVLLSPTFLIRDIEVQAGDRVPAAWLESSLAPLRGRHVMAVSLEAVSEQIGAHPWVAGVELRRELPDRIRIEVIERRPVALLETPEGPMFVDAEGLRIAPAEATAPDLVTLVWKGEEPVPVARTTRALAEIASARPRLAAGIERVEISSEGDFRVVSSALPFPVLLREGRIAEGCERLDRGLGALPPGLEIGEADARFPGRLIIRPRSAGAAAGTHSTDTTEG